MESCLALAELKECKCADARFAGFVNKICVDDDESKSL